MQAHSTATLDRPERTHDNAAIVAALDLELQAAVKANDATTIDRILHPDFILVRGDGSTLSREDVIGSARAGTIVYEVQDEIEGSQTVRLWEDTAVVTACLRIKGREEARSFDRTVWFSDTYVRTWSGWRYAFAQVSSPMKD